MCPRLLADNSLKCPENGATSPSSWNYFIEGDSLHWSLFVPQDLPGLIQLHGGSDGFTAHMNEFMEKHLDFNDIEGNFLPNPYFWGGNEVCMLTVWTMNLVDPTFTQYWSRRVTHLHFSDKPTGLPGNDDYGTMSAWLMTTSLGIFPLAGSKWFFIGSPRIEEASINLVHSDLSMSTLRIVTHNNSADNVYVESILINGVAHTSPFIERSTLHNPKGCVLEFFMTSTRKTSLVYQGELGHL
jgi:putative alpha-1,2-mannosidase